jgi:hypothetical protein
MNVLSAEKRAAIVLLHAQGHTVREIVKQVGCSRQTVSTYLPTGYRRKLLKLIDRVFKELEARNIDPLGVQALLDLYGEVGFRCQVHPEAHPDHDVMPDMDCRLCVRDGLRRFHARRKAEGRPIVPPRRRPKPSSDAEGGEPLDGPK